MANTEGWPLSPRPSLEPWVPTFTADFLRGDDTTGIRRKYADTPFPDGVLMRQGLNPEDPEMVLPVDLDRRRAPLSRQREIPFSVLDVIEWPIMLGESVVSLATIRHKAEQGARELALGRNARRGPKIIEQERDDIVLKAGEKAQKWFETTKDNLFKNVVVHVAAEVLDFVPFVGRVISSARAYLRGRPEEIWYNFVPFAFVDLGFQGVGAAALVIIPPPFNFVAFGAIELTNILVDQYVNLGMNRRAKKVNYLIAGDIIGKMNGDEQTPQAVQDRKRIARAIRTSADVRSYVEINSEKVQDDHEDNADKQEWYADQQQAVYDAALPRSKEKKKRERERKARERERLSRVKVRRERLEKRNEDDKKIAGETAILQREVGRLNPHNNMILGDEKRDKWIEKYWKQMGRLQYFGYMLDVLEQQQYMDNQKPWWNLEAKISKMQRATDIWAFKRTYKRIDSEIQYEYDMPYDRAKQLLDAWTKALYTPEPDPEFQHLGFVGAVFRKVDQAMLVLARLAA